VFYFPGLNTHPIFASKRFTFHQQLIDSTPDILKEYTQQRNLKTSSTSYDTGEHKLLNGEWLWDSYIDKGKINQDFRTLCPITSALLDSISSPSLMTSTPFAFAFFSTLKGGARIAPHYGPCNIRIRCHLPLIVPSGDCGFRIGGQSMVWYGMT
jgi:aspartate beta-hydroxylase